MRHRNSKLTIQNSELILVFGGTTEGRKAVQIIDKAGKPFYYSTKGDLQEVHSLNAIRLTGAMDIVAMKRFCQDNDIRLIIDAAHPFAEELRHTITHVSLGFNIPVIRYDRLYPSREKDIIWCEDYTDAIRKLEQHNINNLLALTGVNTIAPLKPFWKTRETWFRILRREESLTIVRREEFPETHLLFYEKESDNTLLPEHIRPDAILTKESGISGGFEEKITLARRLRVPLFAVMHPSVPESFYVVNGEHGLRRAIEKFLPGFYSLRTGITTGTCATAGAMAALQTLLTGGEVVAVPVLLPNGENIAVDIEKVNLDGDTIAIATVIKDSGDDTDVTHGAAIEVMVKLYKVGANQSINEPKIRILGGSGVGIVTLPGLGLPVGEPAINVGPQQMIRNNIHHFLNNHSIYDIQTIEVTISIPQGEELARRTFNPRLGVTGGISIIGTSGIIQPFSVDAFISSIRKSMEVAKAAQSERIVINSGAKSEKYLRAYYPTLPETAFVQYGNYIGETLRIAAELNISCITLGAMIGKAVKLAEGYLDTHSKKTTMNKDFIRKLAEESGCCFETIAAIDNITLARELWNIIPTEQANKFFGEIIYRCYQNCVLLLPEGELTVLLLDESGDIRFR